ncbi:threonine-phosphate decarboxylase CobD [Thalassotalea piscium]
MALIHGGQLQQVAKQFSIPINEWLDLSTGVAPLSYPIPAIPNRYWQQLPQENTALLVAAQNYYRNKNILVTNGSQAIIKALPLLWQKQNTHSNTVYIPYKGYKEHQQAWTNAGFKLCYYHHKLPELNELTSDCVLVVINPNNPTAQLIDKVTLARYQNALKQLNGLLVVDEAFIDVIEPTQSMCAHIDDSHTLVLRSFGKFFGLAGIRIGFLIAIPFWRELFAEYLGPWQVNGPAQYIAQQALNDTHWQQQQRQNLGQLQEQQHTLIWKILGSDLLAEINSTNLFLTLHFHQQDLATRVYQLLCQEGIYVRLTDEQDALRFGITTPDNFSRLSTALTKVRVTLKK